MRHFWIARVRFKPERLEWFFCVESLCSLFPWWWWSMTPWLKGICSWDPSPYCRLQRWFQRRWWGDQSTRFQRLGRKCVWFGKQTFRCFFWFMHFWTQGADKHLKVVFQARQVGLERSQSWDDWVCVTFPSCNLFEIKRVIKIHKTQIKITKTNKLTKPIKIQIG